jgi:hypothetical protein
MGLHIRLGPREGTAGTEPTYTWEGLIIGGGLMYPQHLMLVIIFIVHKLYREPKEIQNAVYNVYITIP